MTLFLTTHYLEEADKLCDRIAIIDQGKIIKIGSPAELKSSVGGGVIELKLKEIDADLSDLKEKIDSIVDIEKIASNEFRIRLHRSKKLLPW